MSSKPMAAASSAAATAGQGPLWRQDSTSTVASSADTPSSSCHGRETKALDSWSGKRASPRRPSAASSQTPPPQECVSQIAEAAWEEESLLPLGVDFSFWASRRNSRAPPESTQLEALGTCSDVYDFWRYFNSIRKDRASANLSISVFQGDDRPRAGRKAPGGRWILTLAYGAPVKAEEVFKYLACGLVGQDLEADGVVLSGPSTLEVWHKDSDPELGRTGLLKNIRTLLSTCLELQANRHYDVEFVPHRVPTLKDLASPASAFKASGKGSPFGKGSPLGRSSTDRTSPPGSYGRRGQPFRVGRVVTM
eukprot:TRINITY_DN101842_c0_g1_i1.p1 TRINITY_DN101842_c0_g1~~TRINITY_DN101842_c0_g1_i1.p1  ORF type:complete len:308 (+),score=58.65 TRINITY_DN101842_c0_g1_i1:42-965(+)